MGFEVYECNTCKQTYYPKDIFTVHLSGTINTREILEYYCQECFGKSGMKND